MHLLALRGKQRVDGQIVTELQLCFELPKAITPS